MVYSSFYPENRCKEWNESYFDCVMSPWTLAIFQTISKLRLEVGNVLEINCCYSQWQLYASQHHHMFAGIATCLISYLFYYQSIYRNLYSVHYKNGSYELNSSKKLSIAIYTSSKAVRFCRLVFTPVRPSLYEKHLI